MREGYLFTIHLKKLKIFNKKKLQDHLIVLIIIRDSSNIYALARSNEEQLPLRNLFLFSHHLFIFVIKTK
jgi:hypothetical protein